MTISKGVRTALRIGVGDRLTFVVRDDGVVKLHPQTLDLREAYAFLARGGRTITMEELTRRLGTLPPARLIRLTRAGEC